MDKVAEYDTKHGSYIGYYFPANSSVAFKDLTEILREALDNHQ